MSIHVGDDRRRRVRVVIAAVCPLPSLPLAIAPPWLPTLPRGRGTWRAGQQSGIRIGKADRELLRPNAEPAVRWRTRPKAARRHDRVHQLALIDTQDGHAMPASVSGTDAYTAGAQRGRSRVNVRVV
jgi:hypothetical protein